MRYLCLFHDDPSRLAHLPPAERAVLAEERRACDEALRRNGYLVAGGDLEPVPASALVRVRAGDVSVSVGPLKAAGQPVGFALLEARDLNEAIQLAARLPAARHGTVEVRPLRVAP